MYIFNFLILCMILAIENYIIMYKKIQNYIILNISKVQIQSKRDSANTQNMESA